MIAFRMAVVGTMLVLTACAGLTRPIERRVEIESKSTTDNWADAGTLGRHYEDPLKMAYERIHDWDDAMSNIQNANSGSIGVLAPLAALVGYRAARGKSNAATAALAAGGLAGMSLADTFVQVGRLQVYEQGIYAMECAIATYNSTDLPGMDLYLVDDVRDADVFAHLNPVQYLEQYGDAESRAWAAATEADTQATLYDARRAPRWLFAKAVSRITHEVHQAVMGSIVSVQSTSNSLSTAFTPSSPAPAAPPAPSTAKSKKPGVDAVIDAEMDAKEARMENAKKAVTQRNVAAHALAANAVTSNAALDTLLGGCALTVHTTTPEAVSPPLTMQAVGASAPFSLKNGNTLSFRIAGGHPGYHATVVPATDGVAASVATQDGVTIVALKATKAPSASVALTLLVTDDATGIANTGFSFSL